MYHYVISEVNFLLLHTTCLISIRARATRSITRIHSSTRSSRCYCTGSGKGRTPDDWPEYTFIQAVARHAASDRQQTFEQRLDPEGLGSERHKRSLHCRLHSLPSESLGPHLITLTQDPCPVGVVAKLLFLCIFNQLIFLNYL